jgi:outer membrane protein
VIRLLWVFIACGSAGFSQEQQSYRLSQAVRDAIDRYPASRVTLEQLSGAAAAVNLARTAYLPNANFLGQANRATRNNVFGMLLPQSTLPTISGPPLATNSLTSVWGSAIGVQVSWEPFDFGLRKAHVDLAEAGRRRAETVVGRTQLEIGAQAAAAFLTVLAAQQTAVAAQAGVDRSRVLLDVVNSLVKAELRPGADASRARAELAVAETQRIRAEQAIRASKAALAQFLNHESAKLSIDPGPLLQTPPVEEDRQSPLTNHPLLVEQQAVIAQVQAGRNALDRSYYPRFNLQAASYARGTGALPDGRTLGGVSGLGPNIHNWGFAFTVTFPALDFVSLRHRKEIEVHRERSEAARFDQIRLDLAARIEQANAEFDGARQIAQNVPIQLEAARAAEQQASARYRAGLATLIEVAEAQRLVTQTEIDDSLARLNVWRALLQLSAAQGNLEPFLTLVDK